MQPTAQASAHQPIMMERINMATAKKAAPAKKTAAATKAAPATKAAAPAAPDAAKTAEPAKKRVPNAAFLKPLTPSAELAVIIGDQPLPRTEVTKKVWEYIKKHDLQDKDKRTLINADAKLLKVVKVAQVSMFELTKLVNSHLK
jgi:upstream activation factor subunit UAF30